MRLRTSGKLKLFCTIALNDRKMWALLLVIGLVVVLLFLSNILSWAATSAEGINQVNYAVSLKKRAQTSYDGDVEIWRWLSADSATTDSLYFGDERTSPVELRSLVTTTTAFSDFLRLDGTNTPTANIPWGDYDLTGVGDFQSTTRRSPFYTDTCSTDAYTINWLNGENQRITLSYTTTVTLTGAIDGMALTLVLVQDTTGSRTITWPGAIAWVGATAPTLTGTSTTVDIIHLLYDSGYDGGTYWGSYDLDFAK